MNAHVAAAAATPAPRSMQVGDHVSLKES